MSWHRQFIVFILILVSSLVAVLVSDGFIATQTTLANSSLLQPAPQQPLGDYDYFGKLLTQQEVDKLVRKRGIDPKSPGAAGRIGAVQITQNLLDSGENIFFNRKIGDTFGLQGVFGFGLGIAQIQPALEKAIINLHGQPTSNLRITLEQDLKLGSRTYAKGSVINTGFDLERGARLPLGLTSSGEFTCALCHVGVSKTGELLKGVPNGDLSIALLIALAPNTTAGFARLSLNPLDPQYQGNGKTIIDSHNQLVTLPDPQKFESAFDDAVLDVPVGNFESSPDGINNTTQIPSVFTFKNNPYGADGQFAVGPFAGLSAINNAVHSSEINLLAAAQLSAETTGTDPEVYLGLALQNAADERLRLPAGVQIKPSQWLRQVAPDAYQAELQDQIPAPGTGTYPNLRPSLFTYNGLVFSPNTSTQGDPASGPFLFAANAMAAFQNSLVPPPNQTRQNLVALKTNSVQRGAKVFEQAQCLSCHKSPFFTDNKIHPISELETNPARAQSRLDLNDLLVPPKLYTFNNPVPVPAGAEVIDVPTEGIAPSPTSLPNGLLPNGGYKTTSLLGLDLSAPYLHDGGVAVRAGSLQVGRNGVSVTDPSGLGLAGTLSQGKPADSTSSLWALIDRRLREQVVAANRASSALARSNLDGTGHNFYVDKAAGFNFRQQTDLINFLLSLDNNPGKF